jgi:hypothetical protein
MGRRERVAAPKRTIESPADRAEEERRLRRRRDADNRVNWTRVLDPLRTPALVYSDLLTVGCEPISCCTASRKIAPSRSVCESIVDLPQSTAPSRSTCRCQTPGSKLPCASLTPRHARVWRIANSEAFLGFRSLVTIVDARPNCPGSPPPCTPPDRSRCAPYRHAISLS